MGEDHVRPVPVGLEGGDEVPAGRQDGEGVLRERLHAADIAQRIGREHGVEPLRCLRKVGDELGLLERVVDRALPGLVEHPG